MNLWNRMMIKRILLLISLISLLASCQPNSSRTRNSNAGGKTTGNETEVVDEDSLPIDAKELHDLSEPAAKPEVSSEHELALLRRFKIGESLSDVQKNAPPELKLGNPTTTLPIGELPEDELVVEFKGEVNGYFHFNGTPQKVGKLIMVETFTDNRAYKDGANKRRIKSLVKLLGKPLTIRKDEEDEQGQPIYVVDWKLDNQLVRYQDEPEWGSTLSLMEKN